MVVVTPVAVVLFTNRAAEAMDDKPHNASMLPNCTNLLFLPFENCITFLFIDWDDTVWSAPVS